MTKAQKFVETVLAMFLSTTGAVGLVIYLHGDAEPKTRVIFLVIAIVAGSFWVRLTIFTTLKLAAATKPTSVTAS